MNAGYTSQNNFQTRYNNVPGFQPHLLGLYQNGVTTVAPGAFLPYFDGNLANGTTTFVGRGQPANLAIANQQYVYNAATQQDIFPQFIGDAPSQSSAQPAHLHPVNGYAASGSPMQQLPMQQLPMQASLGVGYSDPEMHHGFDLVEAPQTSTFLDGASYNLTAFIPPVSPRRSAQPGLPPVPHRQRRHANAAHAGTMRGMPMPSTTPGNGITAPATVAYLQLPTNNAGMTQQMPPPWTKFCPGWNAANLHAKFDFGEFQGELQQQEIWMRPWEENECLLASRFGQAHEEPQPHISAPDVGRADEAEQLHQPVARREVPVAARAPTPVSASVPAPAQGITPHPELGVPCAAATAQRKRTRQSTAVETGTNCRKKRRTSSQTLDWSPTRMHGLENFPGTTGLPARKADEPTPAQILEEQKGPKNMIRCGAFVDMSGRKAREKMDRKREADRAKREARRKASASSTPTLPPSGPPPAPPM